MDRAFQRIRSLMLRDTFYSVPPSYTQKLLKIQDTFFHFTHKKEISIYFFIFPSFTSSDSALANDGRVTPNFCATSC